jgi:hypothetical protein
MFSHADHHSTIVPYSSVVDSEVCFTPDQAAHYHILALEVVGFVSKLSLGSLQTEGVEFPTCELFEFSDISWINSGARGSVVG